MVGGANVHIAIILHPGQQDDGQVQVDLSLFRKTSDLESEGVPLAKKILERRKNVELK